MFAGLISGCKNRDFNTHEVSKTKSNVPETTSRVRELQEKINTAFDEVFPEIARINSTKYEDYQAIFATATPDQFQSIGQKKDQIMSALIEYYKSKDWSFTAHVLNLAPTGNAAWDTKSRFINDILCANNELSTCTTGAPSLQSVMEWVAKTEKTSNGLLKVVNMGHSRMNNPIVALEFDASPKVPKPTLWFDSTIHGNEPIGHVVVQDIAAKLLDKSNSLTRAWLSKYRVVLIPMLNPDGFYLSTTRISWRKNGRQLEDGRIAGLDLNRAFPTKSPYRAPNLDPFSKEWMPLDAEKEPEVQAMMAYARRVKPVGAISFHSNAHFAVFPSAAVGSADEGFFRKLITEIGKSIRDEKGDSGTYLTGTPTEVFQKLNGTAPAVLGTSIDWMWEDLGTKAVVIELLDYKSDLTWPAPAVRAKAVEGAWPALEKFVEILESK
jgi:hypothetical protein